MYVYRFNDWHYHSHFIFVDLHSSDRKTLFLDNATLLFEKSNRPLPLL
jgi:hypothetical protein